MPEMKEALNPRMIMVGSVTGNDNTVGGGGVYPVADLRELEGLAQGAKEPIAMMDGYNFNGAKAYKDTKLALMMLSNELHDRYHRQTGISFSSIYPGCIAASPLFREKRPWFRKYFPVFMKYITGGFVGEEEAGQRLFQVIVDPRCSKSGVYWSWNGGPRVGRGMDAIKNDGQIIGAGGAGGDWDSIYENDQSDKVRDTDKARMLWEHSVKVRSFALCESQISHSYGFCSGDWSRMALSEATEESVPYSAGYWSSSIIPRQQGGNGERFKEETEDYA
jgi:protochlorophyllide reductase